MFLPVCSLEADLRESDVTGNVEGIDAMERPQAVVELREVLVINRNLKQRSKFEEHLRTYFVGCKKYQNDLVMSTVPSNKSINPSS